MRVLMYSIRLAIPPGPVDCSNIMPPGNPSDAHELFWSQRPSVPVPPLTIEGLGDGSNVDGKEGLPPDYVQPRHRRLGGSHHESGTGPPRLDAHEREPLRHDGLGDAGTVWRSPGTSRTRRTGRSAIARSVFVAFLMRCAGPPRGSARTGAAGDPDILRRMRPLANWSPRLPPRPPWIGASPPAAGGWTAPPADRRTGTRSDSFAATGTRTTGRRHTAAP